MKKSEVVKTGVVLDKDACRKIDRIASREHRSRSGQLRVIIEQWLASTCRGS